MLPWDAGIGVFISELPKHSKKDFPLFFLKKMPKKHTKAKSQNSCFQCWK
jgi:hypothetical protein